MRGDETATAGARPRRSSRVQRKRGRRIQEILPCRGGAVRRARLRRGQPRRRRRAARRHQGLALLLLRQQGGAGHGGDRDAGQRVDRAPAAAARAARTGLLPTGCARSSASTSRGGAGAPRPRCGLFLVPARLAAPPSGRAIKELRRRHDAAVPATSSRRASRPASSSVVDVDTALHCMHAAMSQAPSGPPAGPRSSGRSTSSRALMMLVGVLPPDSGELTA